MDKYLLGDMEVDIKKNPECLFSDKDKIDLPTHMGALVEFSSSKHIINDCGSQAVKRALELLGCKEKVLGYRMPGGGDFAVSDASFKQCYFCDTCGSLSKIELNAVIRPIFSEEKNND